MYKVGCSYSCHILYYMQYACLLVTHPPLSPLPLSPSPVALPSSPPSLPPSSTLRQESLKRQSMTLSAFETTDDRGQPVDGMNASTRNAIVQRMEKEMTAKFDLHPRTASVGVKAAMRLMTGLKRRQAEDGGGVGADAGE